MKIDWCYILRFYTSGFKLLLHQANLACWTWEIKRKKKTDLVSSAYICLFVRFLNKETDLDSSPVETPPSWGIHPGPHRTFETLSPPESKSESKAESKAEFKFESKSESKSETKAKFKSESKSESKCESKSESKGENEIVQGKSYWWKCRYVCFPYRRWKNVWMFWMLAETFEIVEKAYEIAQTAIWSKNSTKQSQ